MLTSYLHGPLYDYQICTKTGKYYLYNIQEYSPLLVQPVKSDQPQMKMAHKKTSVTIFSLNLKKIYQAIN